LVTCSSAYRITRPHSRKEPVQEPARRIARAVETFTVDPEAPPFGILNPVIIARPIVCRPPPFRSDPLRPVGARHAMQDSPPAKSQRRIIGNRCRSLDRLGPCQQSERPRPHQIRIPLPTAGGV